MNRIGFKLAVLALSGVGWLGWPKTGLANPQPTMEAAKEQARSQMDVMLFRIKMFHHEVKNTLQSTVELPIFKAYFSLPESRNNTLDALGVMQFTKAQVQLRQKMEEWAKVLYKRFPIGEACLIDHTGQEHLRVVSNHAEAAHFFSNNEGDSPFFKNSFLLKEGEIFTSTPYMSPDSLSWVIAYTSPVVLENGEKPAFFHFEIPLHVYGKLISSQDFSYSTAHQQFQFDKNEEGRFFLVDKDGLLIADSQQTINTELNAHKHPEKNPDQLDFTLQEKLADYQPHANTISKDPRFLEAINKMRDGQSDELSLTLNQRDYILIYHPIPGRSWTLGHLDPVGGPGFWKQDKP